MKNLKKRKDLYLHKKKMPENKRAQNEAEFDFWQELEEGGRKYWFDVKGKSGGFARYVKTVDKKRNYRFVYAGDL